MDQLLELPLAAASKLISTRDISAVELVEATLARIEAVDRSLHAYASVLAEQALQSAELLDREIAAGRWRGPLHGIPIGVKDNIYSRGAKTEAGARALADTESPYDATVVARLKSAGAVVVGKTTAHELAWGVNDPPTVHPIHATHYPGGSSTGSAVAVSVGAAFGAVGTDTGGSIRTPSSINGIVGMKPTYGRVSCHGVIKLASSLDHVGPMTRTVEDCALLLQGMAGHDPLDPATATDPVEDYSATLNDGVRGVVIGVERDHSFYSGVTGEVRAAVNDAIEYLASEGAEIVEVRFPEFSVMATVLLTILLPEAASFHRQLFREKGDLYDQQTRLIASLGEFVPGSHYVTALRARSVLCGLMKGLFRAHKLDAMIWPTIPLTTVSKADLSKLDDNGDTPFNRYIHHTATANVLGLPAISVPCGRASDNLPIGFELLGRPFEERTLLRIARAYERGHRWHEARPSVVVATEPIT